MPTDGTLRRRMLPAGAERSLVPVLLTLPEPDVGWRLLIAVLAAATMSFLSLLGVPPVACFDTKVLLFMVTVDASYTWLAVLAAANTVLSLADYLCVLARTTSSP